MSPEDTLLWSYATILPALLFGILLPFFLFKVLRPQTKIVVSSLVDIQHILDPASVPVESLVRSRALANIRLINAFQLTNTFVSTDEGVHRTFVRHARQLALSKGIGHAFGGLAVDVTSQLGHSIFSQPSRVDVEYDKFIQILTFKVMISTLFQVNPDTLDIDDVAVVTAGINTLWNLSKSSTTFPPGLLEGINTRLSNWIIDLDNPLNIIIPVYETMWQVVAVGVALLHHDSKSRELLDSYLRHPTQQQFAQWEGAIASVEALISETLRLYPPVRRISRVVPNRSHWVPSCFQPYFNQVVAADISVLQRDPTIWGPDADHFNASRHHPNKLTPTQKSTLLAFSVGGIKCVASSWAPRAAAAMIAAIVEKVNQEGLEGLNIQAGSTIGSRDGWKGWKVIRRD